jgi:hypothetical protein
MPNFYIIPYLYALGTYNQHLRRHPKEILTALCGAAKPTVRKAVADHKRESGCSPQRAEENR